jgi:4-hydroxy-tetrahydrodipicolinate synthase
MILKDALKGVGVAMVTPFLDNKQIDFENLRRLTHQLIENNVDYLVLLGTTGETPTLNIEEKNQIIRTVVAANNQRVPIIVGIGGYSTQEVVEHFDCIDFDGVHAILSITPYYNKPSQEGLYQHFKVISDHSPLPIILYTIFSRTNCNLEPETTLKLAQIPNIIGIKEASGNMNQIMYLLKHKPADFLVISGDDAITLPLMAVGMSGLISVVANAYPKEVADMVHYAMEGKFDQARQIHEDILDITQACFKEGSPSGIKAFLSLQNKIQYKMRLPLTPVSESHFDYIKSIFKS